MEKPTLIIFHSPDCPYCQAFRDELSENAMFSEAIHDAFEPVWVNIHDTSWATCRQQFQVGSVPYFMVIEQGIVTRQVKGYSSADRLAPVLGLRVPLPKVSQGSRLVACGNGIIESGEACDDGNMWDGDGCSSSCAVEPGFICTGEPSVCESGCGNGLVGVGEACDDGNMWDGDGCSSTCQVEPGFICIGEPSICVAFSCGNGMIEAGESCDDANMDSGDGCSSNCEIEPGYACVDEPSVCFLVAVCGNGIIEPGESCDDNNPQDGDGCSAYCQVEAGYTCTGEPSQCALLCGNGSVEFGEECDDGNFTNGDGCTSTCQFEGNSLGVAINEDGTRPSPAAMLDIKSTTRGILIPRMTTTQRNGILNPPPGLMVFDLTTASFWFYNGSEWKEFMAD